MNPQDFGNDPQLVDPNKPLPSPGMAPPPTPTAPKPRGYYELMLSLSDLGAKEKTLKSQQGLADELRQTPMPGMRGNGRIMVKANPLEFLNSGVRQGLGWKQTYDNQGKQQGLADEIRRRIQEERNKGMGGSVGGGMGSEFVGDLPTVA